MQNGMNRVALNFHGLEKESSNNNPPNVVFKPTCMYDELMLLVLSHLFTYICK